jgi:hypothetical protein
MKPLIVTAIAMLTTQAADLRVDHATLAGLDLKGMQQELAAAGLPSEYGGKHANHATEMATISFPDGSYLELISRQPDFDPKSFAEHAWAKYIETNAGPCGWAVRPVDFKDAVKRLKSAGIDMDDVAPSGRRRPDGVRLDWETAQVHGDRGAFFPFLIHDITPHENRVYPTGKPSAPQFSGITQVVIAVKDLDGAIAIYRKAYGLGEPIRKSDPAFGARMASFPGTPVVLASPLTQDNWIAARITKYGDAPCAFAIGKPTKWIELKSVGGRLGMP